MTWQLRHQSIKRTKSFHFQSSKRRDEKEVQEGRKIKPSFAIWTRIYHGREIKFAGRSTHHSSSNWIPLAFNLFSLSTFLFQRFKKLESGVALVSNANAMQFPTTANYNNQCRCLIKQHRAHKPSRRLLLLLLLPRAHAPTPQTRASWWRSPLLVRVRACVLINTEPIFLPTSCFSILPFPFPSTAYYFTLFPHTLALAHVEKGDARTHSRNVLAPPTCLKSK